MITPAISVLSAVEGLAVATPVHGSYIVPITIVILIALFLLQSHGTAGMATVFGPVTLVWFLVIAALGVAEVLRHPPCLPPLAPAGGRLLPPQRLARIHHPRLGFPRGHRRRSALRGHRTFRHGRDPLRLVSVVLPGAAPQLPRPGCAAPSRTCGSSESLLRTGAVVGALPARSCWPRWPRSSHRKR